MTDRVDPNRYILLAYRQWGRDRRPQVPPDRLNHRSQIQLSLRTFAELGEGTGLSLTEVPRLKEIDR